MTELHTHRLDGCAPTPLASYLKALGVLRLLASPANSVKGEAADSAARGWWAGDLFHLRTHLNRGALLRFFLDDYAPSPIVAPWNGGSGFYYREGKTGEKDPATGKMIKTGLRDVPTEATRRIDRIVGSGRPRFARLTEAIGAARMVIREFGLSEAPEPKTGQKAAFIERYRSLAEERATDWVDAALAVTGEQFDSAALLGSGGNDGNLDFSTAFQGAVLGVIDADSGVPITEAATALNCALFDEAVTGAWSAGVSQLAPGNIEAANSGNGFSGAERGDPWSVILMFEGAIAFAGTATRRSAANRPRGSFPFTVSQLASGSGAVGGDDDSSSRAAELWLPLWRRPTTFTELRALLGERRVHLGRAEARTV
jgi:CRISPR-associated protein Csx17